MRWFSDNRIVVVMFLGLAMVNAVLMAEGYY
jgi:hypothetical protein